MLSGNHESFMTVFVRPFLGIVNVYLLACDVNRVVFETSILGRLAVALITVFRLVISSRRGLLVLLRRGFSGRQAVIKKTNRVRNFFYYSTVDVHD